MADAVDPADAAKKAEVFYREVWALLGVAILIVCLRTYGRLRTTGISNFQLDDYLVWLALVRLGAPFTLVSPLTCGRSSTLARVSLPGLLETSPRVSPTMA